MEQLLLAVFVSIIALIALGQAAHGPASFAPHEKLYAPPLKVPARDK